MLHKDGKPVILCAGRIYGDLVFEGLPRMPTLGSETFAGAVSLHAGGGAFNSAAAFSILGLKTALTGTLPSAPFDAIVRAEAEAHGLDLSMCTPAPKNGAPQITVAMTLNGDRSFLSHKTGSAYPPINPAAPSLSRIRHLHIGELKSLSEAPETITQAKAAGWSISLDCGWDDGLMEKGRDLAGLIAQVDVFLPNASEYRALTGSGLPEGCAPLTVVKDGERGATATLNGETLHRRAHTVEAVDTTGAGDAFNGGFLSAWLAGSDLSTCLETGNRCGAAAVQFAGATAGLARIG